MLNLVSVHNMWDIVLNNIYYFIHYPSKYKCYDFTEDKIDP